MHKGVKIAVIAAAVVLVGGGVTGFILLRPKTVDTAVASKKTLELTITESGHIAADNLVTVYAPVGGKIKTVGCQPDSRVEKGTTLASYDISGLQFAYDSAVLNREMQENTYQAACTDNACNSQKVKAAQNEVNNMHVAIVSAEEERDKLSITQNGNDRGITAGISQLEGNISKISTELEVAKAQYEAAQSKVTELDVAVSQAKASAESAATEEERAAALAQQKSLEQSLSDARAERDAIASSVNEISGRLNEQRGNLAAMSPQGMNDKDYGRYLELTRQIELYDRLLNEQLGIKTSAEEKIVNSYTLEQYKGAVQIAELEEQQAKKALDTGNAGVKAPISGIIAERFVDEGAVVEAGTPLYAIQPDSGYKVSVMISRYDIDYVEIGQRADVTVGNKTYEGEVGVIRPVAEEDASAKPKVHVDIFLKDQSVVPVIGLEAEVTIYAVNSPDILSISKNAVYSDDGGNYVYVISDGRVEKKYISCGIEGNTVTEVSDGITEGTVVITAPMTDDEIGKRVKSGGQ